MTLDFYLDKNTDKIKLNLIAQEAVKLPSEISEEFFIAQFKRDEFGYFVDTPIGRVDFDDIKRTYQHLWDNTNKEDRRWFNGAFMEVLENPLFVVRQKYLLKSIALDRPRSSQLKSSSSSQKQNSKSASGESKTAGIIADSFVFVKPYFKFDKKNNKKILHLASFAIDKNGKLIHKTFFDLDDNFGKLKRLLKTPAKDVLYFKYNVNQSVYLGRLNFPHRNADEIKILKENTMEKKIDENGDEFVEFDFDFSKIAKPLSELEKDENFKLSPLAKKAVDILRYMWYEPHLVEFDGRRTWLVRQEDFRDFLGKNIYEHDVRKMRDYEFDDDGDLKIYSDDDDELWLSKRTTIEDVAYLLDYVAEAIADSEEHFAYHELDEELVFNDKILTMDECKFPDYLIDPEIFNLTQEQAEEKWQKEKQKMLEKLEKNDTQKVRKM